MSNATQHEPIVDPATLDPKNGSVVAAITQNFRIEMSAGKDTAGKLLSVHVQARIRKKDIAGSLVEGGSVVNVDLVLADLPDLAVGWQDILTAIAQAVSKVKAVEVDRLKAHLAALQ
jgi:hypothetical protein